MNSVEIEKMELEDRGIAKIDQDSDENSDEE